MIEIYNMWLIEFLNKKINLKEYDEKIKNSDLHFVMVKDLDYYQKMSKPYLNYFYIRNDINIDKLSDEEKEFMEKNKENDINLNIEKFINDTLDKVIKIENDNDENFIVDYGAPSNNYMAFNDSLVIGFRFDEYNNDNNLNDDDWMNNYNAKMQYLNELVKEMMDIGKVVLNKSIRIIKYNEFTITKK